MRATVARPANRPKQHLGLLLINVLWHLYKRCRFRRQPLLAAPLDSPPALDRHSSLRAPLDWRALSRSPALTPPQAPRRIPGPRQGCILSIHSLRRALQLSPPPECTPTSKPASQPATTTSQARPPAGARAAGAPLTPLLRRLHAASRGAPSTLRCSSSRSDLRPSSPSTTITPSPRSLQYLARCLPAPTAAAVPASWTRKAPPRSATSDTAPCPRPSLQRQLAPTPRGRLSAPNSRLLLSLSCTHVPAGPPSPVLTPDGRGPPEMSARSRC